MLDRRLADIASEVLRIPPAELSLETSFGSVKSWDSLGHLHLILEIEGAFDVKFDSEQILQLRTLGQIQVELENSGCLSSFVQKG